MAFLRPGNIIGGGFTLTTSNRVPMMVRDYVDRVLAGGGAGSAAAAAAARQSAESA